MGPAGGVRKYSPGCKRNIVWRGLLRLVGCALPDEPPVRTSSKKADCLARIRELCGEYSPTDAELVSATTHFEALAMVLSKYTGSETSKEDAEAMFLNSRKRGYEPTEAFARALGGRPWPPASRPLPLPELPVQEWCEIEGELDKLYSVQGRAALRSDM